MGSPLPPVVSRLIDDEGNAITLTHEELERAMRDYFVKYGKMRMKFKGFSGWNDGREAIEDARIQHDE